MQLKTEVFTRAKLTQGEIAWMCKVTRATANAWMNGKGVGPKSRPRVTRITAALEAALADEALPLPPDATAVKTASYGLVRSALAGTIKAHL